MSIQYVNQSESPFSGCQEANGVSNKSICADNERILQIGSYSLVGTAKCRPGFQGLELATSGSVYCLCDEKQSIFYNFINIHIFYFFP